MERNQPELADRRMMDWARFLRSEAVLEHFGVTEGTWREAIAKDAYFAESETPFLVGRAVAVLAADPDVKRKAGTICFASDIAREYGFTDYDGRRPDWGRHTIDFSVLPREWIDLFRTGTDLEIRWLTTLAARARKFRKKVPS